jgi:hypothetical protein
MRYEINRAKKTLALIADDDDRAFLREMKEGDPDQFGTIQSEIEALDSLIANSELDWIDPAECGDLTDAPILGIRDVDGVPLERWGFMNYQVRTFLGDLIDDGRAVFTGP